MRLINSPSGPAALQPALNPHAGCFFLSRQQLEFWVDHHWLDYDTSFVSPLESAATLGLAKTFSIFKPCLSTAGWFEIQHHGNNFHLLIKEPKKMTDHSFIQWGCDHALQYETSWIKSIFDSQQIPLNTLVLVESVCCCSISLLLLINLLSIRTKDSLGSNPYATIRFLSSILVMKRV